MVYNWSSISRSLWPARCLLCGAPAPGRIELCTACRASLARNAHACRRCALPLSAAADDLCGACRRRPPGCDRVLAPFQYQRPLSSLILALKYGGQLVAGRVLGQLLAEALPAPFEPPQAVLPVPLHPARLRSRGFNQAAELAVAVAQHWRLTVVHDALQRVEDTPAQAGLKRAARLRNLGRAFRWTGPAGLQRVALVDDVVTTGATVEALARVLKGAGVRRVEVWAVARTPHGAG